MKVNIVVKTNSSKGPLVESQPDGSLIVFLREAALEGKANRALVKILADYYKLPKTRIKIVHGKASKHKMVELD